MSSQTVLAIAAIASAVAAIAAAFVACFSWRVQKRQMHLDIMPELKPQYEFGKDYIEVKNGGKGTASKLRLQKTQEHVIDRRIIIQYSLSPQSRRTISPGETHRIYVVPNVRVDSVHEDIHNQGLDLFRFIEGVGKHKQLGLIYEDIFGQRMLLRAQFKQESEGNYYIEYYGIKLYGSIREMLDWLGALRFRLLRVPREFRFLLQDKWTNRAKPNE